MSYTTFAQLRGALERTGLLDAAAAAGATLRAVVAPTVGHPGPPVYHFAYCRAGARAQAATAHRWLGDGAPTPGAVTLVPIANLRGAGPAQFCPACQHRLLASLDSPVWEAVLLLVKAAELGRAAQRLADAPDSCTAVGRAAKLCGQMERAAPWVELAVHHAASPALAAAHARVLADCRHAAAALTATAVTPAQRERVQARVRAEMVAPNLEHLDALDDSTVLFGIFPHHGVRAVLAEVIDAFTIVASEQHVVLSCPRFVADYISRCYVTRAKDGWPVLVAVPAGALTPSAVRSAAALWSPAVPLPLASLAAAVHAAAMLESLSVGNHPPKSLVLDMPAPTVRA